MAKYSVDKTFSGNASSDVLEWPGGVCTMFAQLLFGGGTLTAEFSIDKGVTWTAVSTEGADIADLTVAGAIDFQLGPCKLRMTLTGSTAPTVKGRLGLAEI